MTVTETALTTVGSMTAEMFRAYDVQHLFLVTGADNSFLIDLHERDVDLVLARSERAAAFMADAYARLTGKPSFVYGQFGPGAMVVLSGLIDSLYGKSPVIALTSEVGSAVRHRFAYQELDQESLFGAVAKWAARAESADRLPDLFRTAVREAVSGCPGPTYLGIPTDLLLQPAPPSPALYAESECLYAPAYRVPPDPAAVDRLAAELRQAKRPVLVAGTGTILSRAWDEVTALAEMYDLPVVTSAGGKGAIAETHRLAHGVTGRYSRVSANQIVKQADFLLVVGSRLSDMTTNREATIASTHRIAHIDSDPGALGRTMEEEMSLQGDAKLTLAQLAQALDGAKPWTEWAQAAAAVTAAWKAHRAERESVVGDGGLTPVHAIAGLRKVLGAEDVVVADTGHAAAWTAALYDVAKPGMQHVRTAGSLGWALPASLGAQLARPKDRVVCVTGDGGIGYHISELETAVRRNLPVVIVLLNNGTLAFEYQVQRKRLDRVLPKSIDFGATDYAGVARSFGALGVEVHELGELEPALEWALDAGGPVLVDVAVDRNADAPVTNFEDIEERML